MQNFLGDTDYPDELKISKKEANEMLNKIKNYRNEIKLGNGEKAVHTYQNPFPSFLEKEVEKPEIKDEDKKENKDL